MSDGPHLTETHAGRPSRRRALLHAAALLAGFAAVALLVRSVGVAALLGALRASARWMPILVALELGRAALEVVATRSLSARVRGAVPRGLLVRTHLVAYAVSAVMPAGRTAGEAVKAALLSRFVGAPEAAAVAAGSQAAVLLGGAVAAVPCALAAVLAGSDAALSGALVAFALGSTALAWGLLRACHRPRSWGWILTRLTGRDDALEAFGEAVRRLPRVPLVAMAAAFGSRALLAAELGVLLHAASGSADRAVLALGVSLLGGAVGDFVPGQLGASDGAFALAAPALGITVADGVAMAMTLHLLQLAWGLLGGTASLWWRVPRAPG